MEIKKFDRNCEDSNERIKIALEYAIKTIEQTELKLSELRQPYQEKIVKFKRSKRA